jgi:hypothetical protein
VAAAPFFELPVAREFSHGAAILVGRALKLPVDLLRRYEGLPATRIVVSRSRSGPVRSCSPAKTAVLWQRRLPGLLASGRSYAVPRRPAVAITMTDAQ